MMNIAKSAPTNSSTVSAVNDTTKTTNEVQVIEHVAKRRKTESPNKVRMITEFSMKDVTFNDIVSTKGKCNIIPMSIKNAPILLQLSGGGIVPKTFGVEEIEDDQSMPKKVTVTLQVSSSNEYDQMVRIRDELLSSMADNWTNWQKGTKKPSNEVIENFCNHIVQPKKLKKNSTDQYWDGLVKSKIDSKCRFVDVDTNEPISYTDLPGRKWHKAIFEFKQIYILGTKMFGITKVLKYLSTSKHEDDYEVEPL